LGRSEFVENSAFEFVSQQNCFAIKLLAFDKNGIDNMLGVDWRNLDKAVMRTNLD
jgi:hypothetical protein